MPTPKLSRMMAAFLVLALAGLALAERPRPKPPTLSPRKPLARKALPPEVQAAVNDVVKADNAFALALYGRLGTAKPGTNLFFSPYSISSALAMTLEGAEGETAEQMAKALHFAGPAWATGEASRVHTGMAALYGEFNAGSKPAPPAIQRRIEALRKNLADANRRAAELRKLRRWDDSNAAAKKSQALAAELNKLLPQYSQYELAVANALWGDKSYPFERSYLDTIHKYYRTGGLFEVDFRNDFPGARKQINGWVEKKTHDRIKDLIPNLPPMVARNIRLILTNAIYFKGEWSEVFKPAQTKDDDFTLSDGKKVRVPLMHHGDMKAARYAAFNGDGTFFNTPARVPFREAKPKNTYPNDKGFAVLELPYKGDRLSMAVLAPRSADGLADLEKKLTAANLQAWVGKLQKRPVHVFLPKFKLETDYDLGETLKAMGMARAFKDPRLPDGAQFGKMSASKDPLQQLYIGKVLHKAFVEVNEKGTEAAAATAVIMMVPTSAPASRPFTPTFRADRPFLFLIRDQATGSILFLGRMTNPTGK